MYSLGATMHVLPHNAHCPRIIKEHDAENNLAMEGILTA
jgi:hypothetical protein